MGAESVRLTVTSSDAEILRKQNITVKEEGGQCYVEHMTSDELSCLLSNSGYVSGARPAKDIDGITTVGVGDTFVTGPSSSMLFNGAVDGQHGLTQNTDNLNISSTTSTTVDLNKYGQTFVAQLLQEGLIKPFEGSDYTKCVVADGKMEEVARRMAELDSLPDKMDEVVFSGDQSVQDRIKKELLDAKIIDDKGNIIDKAQFGKLFDIEKGTITIGGETYNFSKEEDGTQDVSFTETKTTTVSSKFKEMSPEWLENKKRQFPEHWKAQLEDLERQGYVAIVDGRYFTTIQRMQKQDVGGTQSTAEIDPVQLVGNKDLQDRRETQLQEEFLELYDSNPANAQDTLLHTKYYKSYKGLEAALIKMNADDMSDVNVTNYGNEVAYRRKGTLARTYFAQSRNMAGETVYEYASNEDIVELQKKVNNYLEDLRKKSINEQINEYKSCFGDVLASNIDGLSDKQLQQLAEAKAYNEGLTPAQINHMASTQFQNRFNTEMNRVYSEFQDKIAKAQAKHDTKKVEKLRRQLDAKLKEIRDRQRKTENEDRGDYAAMMARGQLNSEIGEGNFKKVRETLTYDSVIAACPEAKKFIEKNEQLFFTDNQFDVDKWQQFWLRRSASREDNNTAEDNIPIQDYFMSLGEAEDILRGNANGNPQEAYVGLGAEALFGDKNKNDLINIARRMAETAGISTEANNTAGLRTAYVFKEMGKGAAAALAADVFGNFVMSKIRIPYAGIVTGTVTGTVSGTVNFARSGVIQDLDHFVSNTYENGRLIDQQITDVLEEHPWHVEGSEDYTKEFSQDYSQGYSGSSQLRKFTIDPWAVGLGAGIGLVKGLIGKSKIHDKEDKNSRVQQYSRRDYNERPSVNPTQATKTVKAPKYKYTAQVSMAQDPVDIENDDCKIKFTTLKSGTYKGRSAQYRDFQDKRKVVAAYYGLTGNESYFNNLYKFVMESTNGLKQGQYNQGQYVNGTTYHFPQTILLDQIEGLTENLNRAEDYETAVANVPCDVRIWYTNTSVGALRNSNNKTQRPGSNATGQVTARRKH